LNEKFAYDEENKMIIARVNGQCLDAFASGNGYQVHTFECSTSNSNQKWQYDESDHRIKHLTHPNLCLDADPTDSSHSVQVWPCHQHSVNPNQWFGKCSEQPNCANVEIRTHDGHIISEWDSSVYCDVVHNNNNEKFTYDVENLMFKSLSAEQCLDAYLDSNSGRYRLHTYECSILNKNQKWNIDATDHRIKHAVHPNLCLDADPSDGSHYAQVWECHDHSVNKNQWFDVKHVNN